MIDTAMRLPGFGRKQRTSRDHPQVSASSRANDESNLHFIVITADEEFYLKLQQIAGTCEWRIGRAPSIQKAESMIAAARRTPMVVYERDPNDDAWRCALQRFNDSPAQPCVLLASQVADDYLWQEVVRNHGYDILPKSAPKEKLIHCLKFAWFWARERGQVPR